MDTHTECVDPDGLLEYSVVFSDRSLNHMSKKFQTVMCDLSTSLKEVYQGDAVAVVPGGGTFAMEAVARQLAHNKHALIIRNGWFSYRWSQIIERGKLTKRTTVLKAKQESSNPFSPFIPPSVDEVVKVIKKERPEIVFAPHVETSSGVILSDEYIKKVSEAAHEVGALFVLDCIASGSVWINMKELGVDVLISAPQKGWSSTPSSGVVVMDQKALAAVEASTSDSFAIDLKKWLSIMQAYESGGHAYHATLPTDSLVQFRDRIFEAKDYGLEKLCVNQWKLGTGVRALLAEKGIKSVAAKGFEAPGVVVSYTDNSTVQNGTIFKDYGVQIAAGVSLMCDEPKDFRTFRVGLFGFDKLYDVDRSYGQLKKVFEKLF